jgi:transposase
MTREEQHERRMRIAHLLRDGVSVAECMRKFGLSASCVYVIAQEFATARPKSTQVTLFRMLGELVRGDSVNEIARRNRVSHQYVSRVRKTAIRAGWFIPDNTTKKEKEKFTC